MTVHYPSYMVQIGFEDGKRKYRPGEIIVATTPQAERWCEKMCEQGKLAFTGWGNPNT